MLSENRDRKKKKKKTQSLQTGSVCAGALLQSIAGLLLSIGVSLQWKLGVLSGIFWARILPWACVWFSRTPLSMRTFDYLNMPHKLFPGSYSLDLGGLLPVMFWSSKGVICWPRWLQVDCPLRCLLLFCPRGFWASRSRDLVCLLQVGPGNFKQTHTVTCKYSQLCCPGNQGLSSHPGKLSCSLPHCSWGGEGKLKRHRAFLPFVHCLFLASVSIGCCKPLKVVHSSSKIGFDGSCLFSNVSVGGTECGAARSAILLTPLSIYS